MLYLDDDIPVNSATEFANEETWFELIGAELLVEHSHTAGTQLVDLQKLPAPNCAKGMLNKSQMSSWIVQARICWQCEMILVFYWQINALIFLALQHSTFAAIHDLGARAMFLEAVVYY